LSGFVHPENQKFCLLQAVSIHELECVTVHVEPTQELVISVVAIREYVTNRATEVLDCLSL
jgi:glutamate/tyrosine decarboxylase-like PLP-dependent enzyme